jgi:regulator of protease activity HflC (stomatin/prohibitin superfamily)
MAKRYGTDLDEVIDGRVRDSTRNALNLCAADLTVDAIYGEQKGALLGCVQERLNAEYEPNGLRIVRVTLNSEVRLPPKVREALEASIAASQEAERTRRQLEQTRAEGEKTIAKATADAEASRLRAEADAVANRTLAESLTPELLEFRRLEVARTQAERWDGHLPQTLLGEGVPILFDAGGR